MKQSNNETMKVAVAMSGGVDSSVVAKMMVDAGHDVIGLFLKLWSDPTCKVSRQNRCCDYEALEDARAVAKRLNIPFYVINAKAEFKKEIVDEFLNEYKKLRTPNPCVRCNEFIKFDLLLKKAHEIGSEKLATGHYARINNRAEIKNNNDKEKIINYSLYVALDKSKDQSYMLYRLKQKQLSKVLFPLGDYQKADVRKLAVKWNLPVKEKPESQEICFFGDKDYRSFLQRYLPARYFKPGDIVDQSGNVLGRHEGLVNYTIGQRKGVDQTHTELVHRRGTEKLKGEEYKQPLYVTGFDVRKNQLIVGEDKDVYSKEMVVSDINWIDPKALKTYDLRLRTKIRYRHEAVDCKIEHSKTTRQQNGGIVKVVFDNPQRAVTPGQSAVFYLGDDVIGGGIIQ
jgi:tRNA-specific 2-thiouridylase